MSVDIDKLKEKLDALYTERKNTKHFNEYPARKRFIESDQVLSLFEVMVDELNALHERVHALEAAVSYEGSGW